MTPMGWFARLRSTDRRRAKRQTVIGLVAHYWDGAAPEPHQVRDIGLEGMYLVTAQRWYPNTLIKMTLARSDKTEIGADDSIAVAARVVRPGPDGVGFAFALQASMQSSEADDGSVPADRKTLKRFLGRLQQNTQGALGK